MPREAVPGGGHHRQRFDAIVRGYWRTIEGPQVHVRPHVPRAPHDALLPGCGAGARAGGEGRHEVIPAQCQRL